jgi:hypothetical protein
VLGLAHGQPQGGSLEEQRRPFIGGARTNGMGRDLGWVGLETHRDLKSISRGSAS